MSDSQNAPNSPSSLDELGERIQDKLKARAAAEEEKHAPSTAQGWAAGMRIVSDIVAGVAVGAFLGWGADKIFGTSPLFLILFFLLGTAGGLRNAVRSAQMISARGTENDKDAGNGETEG